MNDGPHDPQLDTCFLGERPTLAGRSGSDADRAEPLLRPGNTNCGGCGISVTLNLLSSAIGRTHDVQLVIPACCGIVTAGPYPYSNYGAPVFACTFASAAAVASGLARAAAMNGEHTRVIAFAGDGGTYDIGMATLSAAAERDEDILYLCYDNEIYGNTGGQRSSATPPGARTTTTPRGKVHAKKDVLAIMAAHHVRYAASISLAHPDDAVRKFERALDARGFRFLHVLAPCPTGWKSEPAAGIHLIRHAVAAGLFPIVEVERGRDWTVNVEPNFARSELEAWFAGQGRFRGSPLDLNALSRAIADRWTDLRRRATPAISAGAET